MKKLLFLSAVSLISLTCSFGVIAEENNAAQDDFVDVNANPIDKQYGVMRINEELEDVETSDSSLDVISTDTAVTVDESDVITDDNGIRYIPVRETYEKMGFNVEWIAESKTVILENMPQYITFKIGVDGYTFAKTAPLKLGAAPIIIDGKSYVPENILTDLGQ